MQDPSRYGLGGNCPSTATESGGSDSSPDDSQPRDLTTDEIAKRGYYTYRAGEGIVFVPYGLSAIAK